MMLPKCRVLLLSSAILAQAIPAASAFSAGVRPWSPAPRLAPSGGLRLRGAGNVVGDAPMGARMMASSLTPEAPTAMLVLLYTYVPDILEKRGPHRAGHLAGAKTHEDSGKLVAAGAYANPTDGALFLFKGMAKADIETFVKSDPYVVNGLVTSWEIKEWTAVVGTGAF
ncbi:hypothetical protein T484DRAFT_1933015 [Baffinella frigidus]|nr:hypothetical protein T484DRAFT_1933015 [Cryptophyta sp. CCMP2293]